MATPAVRARRRRNRANRRAKVAAGLLPPRTRAVARRRGPANAVPPLGFTTSPRTTFSNTGQRSAQLPRRARRKIGGGSVRQPAGGLPTYALAVVDPANPDVIGTKIPDGDMTPSFAFTERSTLEAVTTQHGTGFDMWLCTPDPNLQVVESTGSWTSTWAFSGLTTATLPAITSIQANLQALRLVSGCITIRCDTAVSSTSGRVFICPVFLDSRSTPANTIPGSLSEMLAVPDVQVYNLSSLINNEAIALFDAYDPASQIYKSTTGPWIPSTLSGTPGPVLPSGGNWAVLVALTGVATGATESINIDWTLNYEGIVSMVTGNITSASKAAPSQPTLLAAVQNMMEDIPRIRCVDDGGIAEGEFGTVVNKYWNQAVNIARGVSDVASIIGGLAAMFI